MNRTPAAGYLRLSQDTDESTSPERQRAAIQRAADQHGFDLAEMYEDVDVSAWSGRERPAWERLQAAVDAGRYTAVVVWKWDRYLRTVRDHARIIDRLTTGSLRVVSVTEGVLDPSTPHGGLFLTILTGFAEAESRTISYRVRSAQQHLVRIGRWRGGVVPYGWQTVPADDGRGRHLKADPDTAHHVVEAVERLADGESARQIARDWNRRGIASPRGGDWQGQSLLRLVRSPRIVGWTPTTGSSRAAGPDDVVRDDDGVPVIGGEPLLDVATWRALLDTLDGRQFQRSARSDACLLTGLVRCGQTRTDGSTCGTAMHGWSADDPRARYACNRSSQGGGCPGNAIHRAYTDEVVVAAFLTRLAATDLHAARRRTAAAGPTSTPDPLVDQQHRLRAALDRLEDDRLVGGVYDDDPDRYRARFADLAGRLDEVERAITDRQVSRRPTLVDVVPADVTPDRVWWDGLTLAKRRAALAVGIRCIRIHPHDGPKQFRPERVHLTWVDDPD